MFRSHSRRRHISMVRIAKEAKKKCRDRHFLHHSDLLTHSRPETKFSVRLAVRGTLRLVAYPKRASPTVELRAGQREYSIIGCLPDDIVVELLGRIAMLYYPMPRRHLTPELPIHVLREMTCLTPSQHFNRGRYRSDNMPLAESQAWTRASYR
jgi:hypothetical protein